MMHVIEQSRDEKVTMYMKLSKRELVEMLLNNQDAVDRLLKQLHSLTSKTVGPITDSTITWQSYG